MFSRKEQPFTPHNFRPRASFLPKSEPKKPRIIVSRQAYALMTLYVEIAQQEVGWLGTVKRLPSGDFLIEKCFLFKQQVHETETEISNEGFSDLSMELLDGVEEGDEADWDVNKLRFWGHSHVHMGTSPSMTDERTMLTDYGAGRSANTGQPRFCFEDSGYPWVIRGIFNKYGEVNFAIFLYTEGLKFEDVEWTVEDPTPEIIAFHEAADDRTRTAWKIEFAAKARAEKARLEQAKAERLRREAQMATTKDAGTVAGEPGKNSEVAMLLSQHPAAAKVVIFEATPTPSTYLTTRPEVIKDDGEEWFNADEAERDAPAPASTALGRFFQSTPVSQPTLAEQFKRGLANLFSNAREIKFRPDITPELRESVQADFSKKVRSVGRYNSWRDSTPAPTRSYEVPDSSSAASDYLNGSGYGSYPQAISEVEGEASGPGTTGGGREIAPRVARSSGSPCNCPECLRKRDQAAAQARQTAERSTWQWKAPEEQAPSLGVRAALRSTWAGFCNMFEGLVNPGPGSSDGRKG